MFLPTIAPELVDLPHVPVSSLEPLQGNFKKLSEREYEKLKDSIVGHGLIVPFFVWLETNKILDGHQRCVVFEREGWEMDVPVVYISAENEQDAKRKLLVISSQYGKVTQEGWDEFTWDVPDAVEIAQFDALPFVFTYGGEATETEWGEAFGKIPDGDRAPFQQMIFTLHDTQAESVKEALSVSKALGPFDTENENSNGNALARICELFVGEHGQG